MVGKDAEEKYCYYDYTYSVEPSQDSNGFIAKVLEFESLSNVGATENEALSGMCELLQFVLDDMYASGEAPPEPLPDDGLAWNELPEEEAKKVIERLKSQLPS